MPKAEPLESASELAFRIRWYCDGPTTGAAADAVSADRLAVVRAVLALKARTPLTFNNASPEDVLAAITQRAEREGER